MTSETAKDARIETPLLLASLLKEMKGVKQCIPDHLPARRPDWQVWLFLISIVFCAGGIVVMVNQNATFIQNHVQRYEKESEKHSVDEKAAFALVQKDVDHNSENMVQHMQWEMEHEVQVRDAEIERLRNAANGDS